jgi:hypothetical protein
MRTLLLIAAASALSLTAVLARGGGVTCSATPNVEPVGLATSGAFGAPTLTGVGTPLAGVPNSFHFEIDNGAPFAPGVLWLSRHEQPTFSPVYGVTLWGAFTVPVLFQCDANGHASVMPMRTTNALNVLCGLDLVGQATVLDFTGPGGATWTNGLRFRFGK